MQFNLIRPVCRQHLSRLISLKAHLFLSGLEDGWVHNGHFLLSGWWGDESVNMSAFNKVSPRLLELIRVRHFDSTPIVTHWIATFRQWHLVNLAEVFNDMFSCSFEIVSQSVSFSFLFAALKPFHDLCLLVLFCFFLIIRARLYCGPESKSLICAGFQAVHI